MQAIEEKLDRGAPAVPLGLGAEEKGPTGKCGAQSPQTPAQDPHSRTKRRGMCGCAGFVGRCAGFVLE